MALIPDAYQDLLHMPALAYLATLGPDGAPQVSAVWFLWDGTQLLFALNKQRQKYRNLVRDPRVAIAISDPANPYRALELRGSVTGIEADSDYEFINAASRKYLQRPATPEERGRAEDRVVIRVTPERVIPFPSVAGAQRP